jgi:Leucine-rich repeat (LRR) protein
VRETREYPSSTDSLNFSHEDFVQIDGLEDFKNLREISFSRMMNISDWSFLQNIDTLETLWMNFVEIDKLAMIFAIPNLEEVILQAVKVSVEDTGSIQIASSKLVYLEITDSELTRIPSFYLFPDSLKFANFGKNSISQVDEDILVQNKGTIFFLAGNPIRLPNIGNCITGESYYDLLPSEYLKYSM